MEVKSNGIKKDGKEGEALQEVDGIIKKQVVTMAMEVFDCPVCSTPLRPPIFQCSKGDFICSACRDKLPESERTASQRCYGMERVVNNIFVPCKYGCNWKITYYKMECHEKWCPKGPCLCPVSDCDFFAPTPVLLDHLTTLHQYPSKSIKYFVPFELPVHPGSHVLCGGYDRLFLLDVAPPESLGHAVSLACVQRPDHRGPTIGCSVCFSCFKGHHQVSTLNMENPSQPMQMQRFCVVPKVPDGEADAVLKITIDLDYYEEEHELAEEDDSDKDYDVHEDEDEEDDDESEEEKKVGDKDDATDDRSGDRDGIQLNGMLRA